jgi:hypothetical protein
MVQIDANSGGLPKTDFDDLQAQLAANRRSFYQAQGGRVIRLVRWHARHGVVPSRE